MPEKDFTEVSPAWRALYEKGRASLDQGDCNNAIIAFNHILDEEPGLVECRESLREAQLKRADQKTGCLQHFMEDIREISPLAGAEIHLHSQPLKAMRAAEGVLNHSPTDILAHKIFAKAALAAGLPQTALLSVNFILKHGSENLGATLELAEALARTGKTAEAMAICGRLLKEHPGDRRVTRLFDRVYRSGFERRAKALPAPKNSKRSSGARPTPGIRQALPDLDAPGAIAKYEALLTHGPRNLKTLKVLARLYARKSDFSRALEYALRARQVAYRTDPELEKLIAEITPAKS